jgi:CubicO group peptidase (beta-lactamase class C family)
MKKSALIFSIIAILSALSVAQTSDKTAKSKNAILALKGEAFSRFKSNPDEVKKNLAIYLDRVSAYGFSGQVLVAEKGKILLDKAYGFADRERQIPNTPQTVFNVASFTKQFTAAAVLRLEADGKLKTGDSIGKYLENVPADKAAITIHQLLTHTSGLARGQSGRNNTTRDETVAKILKQSLAANAGERFIYSNNGYHLLAAVIEKVSGQTYAEYLSEKLFQPAGISRTGVYQDPKWNNDAIAQTYNEWMKLEAFTDWNKNWNYGSGSIVSTANDLYKWFLALSGDKILPREEKEKLFAGYIAADDENTSYGYGWFVRKLSDGNNLVFHGGDNRGYHSEFRRYVEDERIIIILANYEMLEPDGVAVQKRIIANNLNRILSGEKYDQPLAVIKLPSRDLKKYEGEYRLAGGDKFKVWSNGQFLSINAEGQEAINAIAGYEGKTIQKYAEANSFTEFILKSIASGEKEKIKSRLSAEDYENFIPFLAKDYESFKAKWGELKEINVQGTTSFPWDESSYRTNVILRFEKGATDLFLGWQDGKLYDVTTETGRPFPLMMPLAAQSKTDFSIFEFINSKQTRISFVKNGTATEIKLKTSGKELTARKINKT